MVCRRFPYQVFEKRFLSNLNLTAEKKDFIMFVLAVFS